MISVSVGLFEASAGAGEGKFLFEVADGRGAEGDPRGVTQQPCMYIYI